MYYIKPFLPIRQMIIHLLYHYLWLEGIPICRTDRPKLIFDNSFNRIDGYLSFTELATLLRLKMKRSQLLRCFLKGHAKLDEKGFISIVDTVHERDRKSVV